MVYLIGILISLSAGFLLIRLLTAGRLNLILHILLALALGLGIDGVAAFYTHILFNQFNRWIPIGIVVLGIISCVVSLRARRAKQSLKNEIASWSHADHYRWSSLRNAPRNDTIIKHAWGLLTLGVLAIPLTISAYHYPLGGWDAWSCWNLKAKFIFLGGQDWKNMFLPGLWRSNTHYPLLWPLINVWFWDLGGQFNQAVPMFNSILFALLTAGILLFGLLELTGVLSVAIAAAVIVTALPLGVMLNISQYSDGLLGLFLLSAFMCLLLAEKHNNPKLKILSMIFLGLICFTKDEGMIIAVIAACLVLWQTYSHLRHSEPEGRRISNLILAFILAASPMIIFSAALAPHNEAFINGLTSMEKPANWTRLSIILVYPWFEAISGKWNGLWFLVVSGVLLAGKKLWQKTLGVIGISLALYLGVVMAYYGINTFFEIGWWLENTLSRVLFVLVPTIALWIGLGLYNSLPLVQP